MHCKYIQESIVTLKCDMRMHEQTPGRTDVRPKGLNIDLDTQELGSPCVLCVDAMNQENNSFVNLLST